MRVFQLKQFRLFLRRAGAAVSSASFTNTRRFFDWDYHPTGANLNIYSPAIWRVPACCPHRLRPSQSCKTPAGPSSGCGETIIPTPSCWWAEVHLVFKSINKDKELVFRNNLSMSSISEIPRELLQSNLSIDYFFSLTLSYPESISKIRNAAFMP